MDCRGCGARGMLAEVCPFCGHDSAFERIQRTERSIGWFWKAIYALVLGLGLLIFMSLSSPR